MIEMEIQMWEMFMWDRNYTVLANDSEWYGEDAEHELIMNGEDAEHELMMNGERNIEWGIVLW